VPARGAVFEHETRRAIVPHREGEATHGAVRKRVLESTGTRLRGVHDRLSEHAGQLALDADRAQPLRPDRFVSLAHYPGSGVAPVWQPRMFCTAHLTGLCSSTGLA